MGLLAMVFAIHSKESTVLIFLHVKKIFYSQSVILRSPKQFK